MKKLKCKKCKSHNIVIQAVGVEVKKKKGWKYWLLGGWIIDILSWIFLLFWRAIYAIFRKKTKIETQKIAICQNCGHSWKL